jgi:hypothetical protein
MSTPHEARHSIDEVLGWFETAGVDFLSSVPVADGRPFTKNPTVRAVSTVHRDGSVRDSDADAPDRRS